MKKLNIKGGEFEMQKIELKKIENIIELDTKVEGCGDDCTKTYATGYSYVSALLNSFRPSNCYLRSTSSAKVTSWW